jgi:hypothetical protein
MGHDGVVEARAALTARLQARRSEIEQAALTRVYAVSDPREAKDPEYLEGLRAAVTAALDYGFSAVERGEERAPPIPAVLLTQARIAARSGISLDTVLRRYFAGYTLLGDFLVEEAEEGDLAGTHLKSLLRTQACLFERLIAAVGEEHAQEVQRSADSTERRAERVERLLAGELLDLTEIPYEFDAHHTGLIASGERAPEAIRHLASHLDRSLLAVQRAEGVLWAWLGGRRRLDSGELKELVSKREEAQLTFAIGESGHGLAGWRLTHRQAAAALPIVLRGSQAVVRYADVALLAALLTDDVLSTSLRQIYLTPLSKERDKGKALRQTLRAYFDAERNISSAAAILGVNRNTVASRLRTIETMTGRPLAANAAELEAALDLAELQEPLDPKPNLATR